MAVAGGGRSLEQTPTWAVATFCFGFVLISIINEYINHLVGKWFKKKQKRALYEAIEKIKSVGQSLISDICIPESVANTWHPCNKEREEELNKVATTDQEETESEHRHGGSFRRVLAAASSTDKCAAKAGMDSVKPFCVVVMVLVLGLTVIPMAVMCDVDSTERCEFPALYNFGDSNSDTGGKSAAMTDVSPQNGETFFGHPSGRFSDGRLIIDFIAENLKLQYLSAYLDSIGANFRQGANFATGGSSIRPPGYSPFHLAIQISQFVQFKSRTMALYHKFTPNRKTPPFRSVLPRPRDFSRALYTLDIGQNDLAYGLKHSNEEQVRAIIPDILDQFSQAVQQLYKEGARFFWIHNTGPIGCLPNRVLYFQPKPSDLDQNGCMKSHNEVAQEFNKQLKDRIMSQLRVQLPQAAFTYVDVYAVKYALISNAKNQGFVDPMNICCGSCAKGAVVNGTVCDHPSMHISWDGTHYSEAANFWVASHILKGSFSDPPLPIHKACHHPTNI
ncbi:hypothetical protein EZV62_019902 [Acer yangbiense]|uniref:MLO-like protein n=1 Tax=Acer yangbiense TaxID=1000413 RepID=A0A5C7HEM1_9ROSI|nr:hypothetical protein EZV62_019902 [Acer yangbiense]